MKKIIVFTFLLFHCLSYGQVPKSLDSLKVFIQTKPKDTTYVLALKDYAFFMVMEGKFVEANKAIGQMQTLSNKFNYGAGFYNIMYMKGVVEYSNQNSKKAMYYFLEGNKII